jgi:prevent-host-death family protein
MFVVSTNQMGTIAELKIAAAAAQLDIPVLRPITDHCRYDLALEVAGRLLRVQCKWGSLDSDGAVIRVNLQRSWLSPHGYVRGGYFEEEIDAVAVYCGDLDRCYLLPCALIADRRGIYLRLSRPRNAQQACINLAADFEFDGAVAQLGRATRWQRVGQGFESPQLHSTSVDVGSNDFRNRFGYYLERAAAGDEICISRHGRPYARLVPAQPSLAVGWIA